jgi:hypothetical protein
MMKKNTFKDYKLAIKEHFLIAQKEDISGILANPSPAQMRNFCSLKCDKGISRRDEAVFRLFFETKEGDDIKKSIERCNIDKFKPIISFLKGEKDGDNAKRVEMAACIVDYKPRPYHIFANTSAQEDKIGKPDENTDENDAATGEIDELDTNGHFRSPDKQSIHKQTWIEKHKVKTVVLFFTLIISGLLIGKKTFKEKECMQWNKDKYVEVDCLDDKQQNHLINTIVPVNKQLLNFKKIEVCDTTTFFRHDKPLVWYCKVNGKLDFFNSIGTGFHPETGKALKPISQYIIEKYILGRSSIKKEES